MGQIEKLNSVAVQMGFPGSGKSALLKQHIGDHLRAGAFAFVQDPDKQFADMLPVYDSPGAYTKAQRERQAAGQPVQLGASIATTDEAGLTQFVLRLAETQGKRYVFVGYDEAVLLSESSAHYVSDALKNLLARRRHLGVALEILSQDLGQLHALWQRLATDLYLFKTTDETRLKVISSRFGISLDVLKTLMGTMRDSWDYLHIRHGKILRKS